jgi:miniconductance mechanosensitive channel
VFQIVYDWLQVQGLEDPATRNLAWVIVVLGVALLAGAVNWIVKRVLLTVLSFIIKRTPTMWDDALLERRVLHRGSHVAPALVFYYMAPTFPVLRELIERLSYVYILVVGGLVASAFVNAAVDVYQSMDIARNRPVKGFAQVGRIVIGVVIGVLSIAVMFKQSPLGLLGGLGAMTAVLLLVFKDTILGLVASFQMSTSDLIRVGDWIEMPKFNADGTVIDISLHTVRVQNGDKTITAIPTYALVSDSFRNWRGVDEADGRRIKRSLNIDLNTVKFCTDEMLERFLRDPFAAECIRAQRSQASGGGSDAGRLTNLGIFRAYVTSYLKNHAIINQDMLFLVRQLQPNEHGVPIEVVVFSREKDLARYEEIQAAIFEHLMAVVETFDLRLYQNPSGTDLARR